MDILAYKWFILGGFLGIIQFSLIIYRGKKEIPGPAQFLIYGAILGALVYGWLITLIDKYLF
ncbi:MAG: hypothetical protein VW265_01995 [Hyphomicrobiales bacterium]|jgi:hypothetical protein|nr:hypothetical protein [Alphaproteobacteria bacterium]|tara:strand:+ start:128 stop:313 length:186 start_codon:yes stop_codon:yes gene_type:complete